MTILNASGNWAICIWTDYVGRAHTMMFPTYVLQKPDLAKR
jgi:hypothetical protein